MWSGKFVQRGGRLGYNIILRNNVKTPADNEEDKTKEDDILNQLNNNAYNELILAQYDMACFQIFVELVTKEITNGWALLARGNFNKKFQSMTKSSKTRLGKK